MAFCNPVKCVHPPNSSIITYNKHSTNSIKTLLRRQLFKKSKTPVHSPVPSHASSTTARFQRIKGSNFVREVNPKLEYSIKTDSTNNYDMTIFHEEQLDDTYAVLSRRRSKRVPSWARKSELQLAFINQIYFNDKNPEDIFGTVEIDAAHEMVKSLEFYDSELSSNFSFSMFSPNFV
ncbi:unnamed protein product [Rotaria socialis]|uniref:Inner centromere protein ARK-binding domain-containing protein n=2 Tax=Rotaria socialis TaxID=392032 RepID=A0A821GTU3_9BILA|nr:unnamed protein product [Rotaria socialis]CAF3525611.1 unnamed protein product [Rotaria socialis]CAF3601254.1 unnamed protein product [Rotaria socialis]CAF4413277.1 unnamed protein product [Rotaria socialis]CAF4499348.1 unnamed protein product [Rotaria socialis]